MTIKISLRLSFLFSLLLVHTKQLNRDSRLAKQSLHHHLNLINLINLSTCFKNPRLTDSKKIKYISMILPFLKICINQLKLTKLEITLKQDNILEK